MRLVFPLGFRSVATMAELETTMVPFPLPEYSGYFVRHPAPSDLAIDPRPFRYNEPRYKIARVAMNSEARKRAEGRDI